ncbi:hypothetical protein [Nostoc sp. MG11]|uniref:hypothetical protein n=1 Tax=Nostoc sp. MG11 TaxID=2721166 RepID=UPI00186642BC|nr:hypothetical protein [Nostoc sp. MG11]
MIQDYWHNYFSTRLALVFATQPKNLPVAIDCTLLTLVDEQAGKSAMLEGENLSCGDE